MPARRSAGNDPVSPGRRVGAVFWKRTGMITTMKTGRGRPSLGQRTVVTANLPAEVRQAATLAAHNAQTCLSAFLADVLALHTGRTDLIRHLNQRTLPRTNDTSPPPRVATGRHVTIRVPLPIADTLEVEAANRGIDRSTYIADVISLHLDFPEYVRAVHEEVMPLAI